MKKTIWLPVVAGLILGFISFMISAADLTIKLSRDMIIGPWEILNVLGAVLFGPISILITQIGMDLGAYYYIFKGAFPEPQAVYISLADSIAHLIALLIVTLCYRYIYKRFKIAGLLAVWIAIIAGYYFVTLLPLQALLFNIAVPGLGATYVGYVSITWPEFVATTIVSTLIMLALPARYRHPLWYESE